MARIFVALPIDAQVRHSIGSLVQPEVREVRWVQEVQYHVTLKFLGEVAETRLNDVCEAVDDAAAGCQEPLRLRARGVGAFPGLHNARVLWVGLQGDTKQLAELHSRLERALVARGFAADERPFRAHITIGRLRNPGPAPQSLVGHGETDFGHWTVPEIQVMESILRPQGPIYKVRHAATLPTE